MSITQLPENFPIRIKYRDTDGKWYFEYECKEGLYWRGYGYDSDEKALEGGIKYVKSQLLGIKRQAQEKVEDASSRLEQLNCAVTLVEKLSLNVEDLKDFQKWKKANDDNFSLWNYLFGVTNIEIALALTKLFWPDFVEHNGGIFLSEAFNSQTYEEWKFKLRNNVVAIEQVMNHQHVDDFLPNAQNASINNLLYLGQTLAQMWESRLKLLYPQRRFQVKCDHDEDTVVVTFFQDN